MECPVCKISMVKKTLKGCTIDVCPKCEGVLSNDKTLKELFNLHITKGRVLRCPACKEKNMVKEHIGNIELDLCHSCGSVWLDKSELAKLWFSYKNKK